MYNGIGLQTTRGSGTNGYVQRNMSQLGTGRRDNRPSFNYNEGFEATLTKKPNKDILEHERKRNIEVKCIEMQDMMEEQGYVITVLINECSKLWLFALRF